MEWRERNGVAEMAEDGKLLAEGHAIRENLSPTIFVFPF